jgi:uncharacterized membrane protein
MDTNQNQRLAFIDVLRGIACVWMVQTHVINTCIADQFRSGNFWNWLNISNGFVAVCFIFCAGAGFSIFTTKYNKELTTFTPTLRSYLQRLGFILFIGFVLQLPPEMSWSRLTSMTEIEWMKFYEFDVLHCIVASSLISLILINVFRISQKSRTILFGMFSIVCYTIPLYLWNSGVLKVFPYEIATIFERPPLSAFPLFPWMGHFFMGICVTNIFTLSQTKRRSMVIVAIVSVLMIMIMLISKNVMYSNPFDAKEWWDSAFSHFVYRISVISLIFALLFFIEQYLQNSTIAKFFQILGKESLVIYALHLFILYTTYKKMGIKEWYFFNSSPLEASLITLILVAVCFAACVIWSRSKKKYPQGTKIVFYGFWFWFFMFFFFGKDLGLVVQP